MDRKPSLLTLQSLLQIPSLRALKVRELHSQDTLNSTIINILDEESPLDHPFYIMDLGMLITLYHSWAQNLPTLKPFFPVRCNSDPALLATLAALGAGFDCATRAEIACVLSLSVTPDRILFSNPCKIEDHIKYAAHVGVNMLVFDSIEELEKVWKFHPHCSLLLHIHVPNDSGEDASRNGSTKRGALIHEVGPLLKHAQRLGLDVRGISLEPEGSGSRPKVHRATIELLHNVFQAFASLHLPRPRVLNIGGGFDSGTGFYKEAHTFCESLRATLPDFASLSLIVTPGRFLAETSSTLITNVIGKRVRGELYEYWINDGVYGSMNAVVYHGKGFHPMPLAYASRRSNPSCKGLPTVRSTVFGPTCDALDTVFTNKQLPELCTGDWLVFPKMGAYSYSCASNFNGFLAANIRTKYIFSKPSLTTKC
ncbi:ornithine decarboxylase-like [Tasmannia lanceolata]|uniref:ornithine decarboxylase-like n=1 Tax=Tasmannia lanceolata TaxID=3420 RepID=UPI0040631455